MKHMGRLLMRVTIGGLFVGHGTQKLFGWFGGHGLSGTAGFFEQIGMRPGKRNALAAGLAETAGGAAIAAGAGTPLAASGLIATMLTAINRVHWKKGPWAANGGYEYNAVLIAALLALVEVGPGELSVDASQGLEWYGPWWMLGSALLGVAGAVGAHLLAESHPAPGATETALHAEAVAGTGDGGPVGTPAQPAA
jgi:putative oxidoreductase